jgi:hypothetical protein
MSYPRTLRCLAHVRTDVSVERRFLHEPHGVIYQKTAFFSFSVSSCASNQLPSVRNAFAAIISRK